MQKKKIKFRHRIEYLFFMAFVLVVKISPLFLIRFNRAVLGFLLKRVSKRHLAYMKKNLGMAFPRWTPEQVSGHMEAVCRHFAMVFVEIILMFVKRKPDKILKPIEVKNIEAVEKALEKQKGVILFSAHFGNWELVPYILNRRLDLKINSIAREMNNPLIERKVLQFREYMGSEVIYKKNSVRTMLKRFEDNGVVFLLIDQNTIEREAVFVDFFGHPTSAVPSVSQLHLRKDIPVVPLFLHYEEDKIVLEILDEVKLDKSTGNREDDTVRLTQQCTALIEEHIRKHPEQWLWFHDRWRTQPSGDQAKPAENGLNGTIGPQVKKENEALA